MSRLAMPRIPVAPCSRMARTFDHNWVSKLWTRCGLMVAELGARLDTNSVDFYLSQVEQLHYAFESANAELTAALRRGISPELE